MPTSGAAATTGPEPPRAGTRRRARPGRRLRRRSPRRPVAARPASSSIPSTRATQSPTTGTAGPARTRTPAVSSSSATNPRVTPVRVAIFSDITTSSICPGRGDESRVGRIGVVADHRWGRTTQGGAPRATSRTTAAPIPRAAPVTNGARPCSWLARRPSPSPPGSSLPVELDELGGGRRVLRGLVVPPSACEPGEPHRQP